MTDVESAVRSAGVVAVMRLREHSRVVDVGERLISGGVTVMEVTLDDPASEQALRVMVERLGDRATLGAGTVLTRDDVLLCRDLGGRFCVSPHTDPELIGATLDAGLEPIPGAMTPTEVAVAVAAGARLIKVFPAGPLGPAYLKALRGPFEKIAFVPTGGIRHDLLEPWYAAGAVAVGLGSDLVSPRPTARDLDIIGRRARTVARQAGARERS